MVPNIITGVRLLLLFPILTCVAKGQADPRMFRVAAIIFLIAIATDMLDGQAARRLNQVSVFGGMFDLTADRLLMTPTLILMNARGAFHDVRFIASLSPKAYVLLIVLADITVIAGVIMYSRLRKRDPSVEFPTPTPIAKATYPVQGAVVFFALLQVKPGLVSILMILSAAMTVAAFISYMGKGSFVFKQGLPVVLEDAAREFSEEIPEKGAGAQPEQGGGEKPQ